MNIRKYSPVTLVIILLLLNACFKNDTATIKPINTYSEIKENTLFSCDNNTLVTFDVDDTLIIAVDMVLQQKLPKYFELISIIRHPTLLNQTAFENYFSIIFQEAERYVFDTDSINFIKQLKTQNCKVIGLTSAETGSYGKIESMERWRVSMLKHFGIEFSNDFSNTCFKKLPVYRNNYPCLYEGILFANQQNKGKVLEAFLNNFKLRPTKIISFDDDKNALNSINNICVKYGIKFIGYHYCGANKLAEAWDNKLATLQLDYLIKNEKWLSDQSAKKLLS